MYVQITPEFLGLRMRNFQGIIFVGARTLGIFSNLH